MPLELITKVNDEMAIVFPISKLAYALMKPLVYPHLIESLAYTISKGPFTTVTTNALTLKQKTVMLSMAGLNEL